jgi:hypothetical protein
VRVDQKEGTRGKKHPAGVRDCVCEYSRCFLQTRVPDGLTLAERLVSPLSSLAGSEGGGGGGGCRVTRSGDGRVERVEAGERYSRAIFQRVLLENHRVR